MDCNGPFQYGIEVYSTHAIIKGKMSMDVFNLFVKLCSMEGFQIISDLDGQSGGFKVIKTVNPLLTHPMPKEIRDVFSPKRDKEPR